MQNLITLHDLTHFLPSDYEEYRNGGEALRRELTDAVIRELAVPAGWNINGEYRAEFGGLFPVQCRLSPSHDQFYLALCSPGEVSPDWLMVFVNSNGTPAAVLRTEAVFLPDVFSRAASLVATLDGQGYSQRNIISMLALEGNV